jgi:hypothetical protein
LKSENDLNTVLGGKPVYPAPRALPEDINVMKHRWAARADDGLRSAAGAGRGFIRFAICAAVFVGFVGLIVLGIRSLF